MDAASRSHINLDIVPPGSCSDGPIRRPVRRTFVDGDFGHPRRDERAGGLQAFGEIAGQVLGRGVAVDGDRQEYCVRGL